MSKSKAKYSPPCPAKMYRRSLLVRVALKACRMKNYTVEW